VNNNFLSTYIPIRLDEHNTSGCCKTRTLRLGDAFANMKAHDVSVDVR